MMFALSILRIFSLLSALTVVSILRKPNCASVSRLNITFFFWETLSEDCGLGYEFPGCELNVSFMILSPKILAIIDI